MSAIKDMVIQIDFDNHKVRLLRSADDRHSEWGKEFALNFR
jgi:hypothetical protein